MVTFSTPHLTMVLVKSKDSGLVFIGGVYLAPPLLTSLVVVGLAFTFDPSLVVIGSYCGGGFY